MQQHTIYASGTNTATWITPVTYTMSGSSQIYYQTYSSANSTASWTPLTNAPDDDTRTRVVEEPCPDCVAGALMVAGQPHVCGACDGTGMTWHYASEESN